MSVGCAVACAAKFNVYFFQTHLNFASKLRWPCGYLPKAQRSGDITSNYRTKYAKLR